MRIIGCDYHPGFQQIAFVDTETGELQERRLQHPEEAEKFYRELAAQGLKARVGMEASGHARWFERLLAELQFELWIGDAAEIRTKRVRKQKTDRQDAQLILRLMLKDDFPQIWVPDWENRDLRQLLWHRHRMVQARTRIMNQLQAVALNEGLPTLQEAAVAGSGTRAAGGISVGSVGEPATARSAGVAGPAEPDDRGADANHRAGSREVSCGATFADASRSRFADGAGFRADHRESGTVSVWQADRELSGTGAVGGVEWRSATAGTHQQARQHAAAFPAGGSGASDGAQPSGMAEQVFSPGDATRAEDCEGGDGPQASPSVVLDDAQGMGLRASEKIRSARGTARKSPWCVVEHRVIDWASRSSSRGSLNSESWSKLRSKRCMGRTEFQT
jgi:Transposase